MCPSPAAADNPAARLTAGCSRRSAAPHRDDAPALMDHPNLANVYHGLICSPCRIISAVIWPTTGPSV